MAEIRYIRKGGLAQPRIHTLGAIEPLSCENLKSPAPPTTKAAAIYNKFAGYIYEKSRRVLCAAAAAEKNLAKNLSKNEVLP